MEQKGEVLGKAKKGHCKSRVGTNVGAGRLGAGWVGGKVMDNTQEKGQAG